VASLNDHLPYALRQFESQILIPIKLFGIDMPFTTSSSAKLSTAMMLSAYLYLAMREQTMVPGRLQASAELLYSFVADTVTRVTGPEGKPSIPFVFTVFTFVLFGTLLGLTPIWETFTSHLVITLALGTTIFIYANVTAFRLQGLRFFRFFLPPNLPVFVAPIVVLVEVVSYLFRPITLGFRLFANIFAGHVMLKLFADFCTMLSGAFGTLGIIASIVPVMVMVILFVFEIMIVCIQAYIFLLITSMYLRDAMHAH
jgi:F-type H+-transporting ATPase subunit a